MRIPRTEAQKKARNKQLERFRNKKRLQQIEELEYMQASGYVLSGQQLYNLKRLKQTVELKKELNVTVNNPVVLSRSETKQFLIDKRNYEEEESLRQVQANLDSVFGKRDKT